jgi:hypothetical protein
MGAKPPVDHDGIGHRGEKMVEAHRFSASNPGSGSPIEGAERIQARAAAVETAVRELLQVGVISSSGLYKAPNSVPNPPTVTVSATAAADSSNTVKCIGDGDQEVSK